jgi:hypothetical protein
MIRTSDTNPTSTSWLTSDGPGSKRDDPWPIEDFDGYPEPDHCVCPPEVRPTPPKRERPEYTPKPVDCCTQMIEILRCLPGFDERCISVRKPKASAKVKVAGLCGTLPIKERIAPILLLILRRYIDGVPAGEPLEHSLHAFLDGLPADQLEALQAALKGYTDLPAARRDCVFETRFDDWPDRHPLDPDFIARNVLPEIMVFGRLARYGMDVLAEVKQAVMRPWEQSFDAPGEPGRYVKLTGPWPWICAVSPVAGKAIDNEKDWYRNESACTPGNIPRGSLTYHTHEFAWSCSPPAGGGAWSCRVVEPGGVPAVSGGFGGFAECSGGIDYRVTDKATNKQVCLTIPKVERGNEVGLRGLNFLSPNSFVHIRKVDYPGFRPIPPVPLSDWQPDPESPNVATCAVRDHAYFIMPSSVKDGLNDVPLPPGRYAIRLVVPNVNNVAIPGQGTVAQFTSNELLLELEPDANQRYQIVIDEAFCDEETDGLGSDEPWFRAITATAEFPMANTTLQFPPMDRVEIMSAKDVDSGESISFPPAVLFDGTLGRKVVAIGVIGLEVDSEDAARKQIDAFFDAYGAYLQEFLVQLGANTSAGVLGSAAAASAKAGAISPWVWVAGGAMAAIFVGGLLYAVWAPADPIALDALTFTSRQLFDLTDTNLGLLPASTWLRIEQLRMVSEPLHKQLATGGQTSTYSERRRYHSTWENSRYALVYRHRRA